MEQREKETIEKILAETKETKVPDGLRPEQIEKVLKGQGNDNKRRFWKRKYTYGIAAACSLLLIGGVAFNMTRINQPDAAVQRDEADNKVGESSTQIATAKNYDEVYQYMKAELEDSMNQEAKYSNGLIRESAESTDIDSNAGTVQKEAATLGAKTDVDGGGHSKTNVRQEGVDEGDYVKTDGKYMYILKESAREIVVVDLQKAEMEEIASIDLGADIQVSEFYLTGNKLIALGTENLTKEVEQPQAGGIGNTFIENTKALTYDVSNPQVPKKMGSITQSGRYYSSRVVGNYMYIFSQFYADLGNGKDEIEAYVPQIQGNVMEEKNIYMPYVQKGNMYIVVTSVDIGSPGEIVDSKAVFSQNDSCYVSNDNIYIYGNVYEEKAATNQTAIRKIAYKDGTLTAVSQCKIKGYINDSFSIDEFEGNLRVVATVSPVIKHPEPRWYNNLFDNNMAVREGLTVSIGADTNSLYVLDGKLEMMGSINGLAKNERVYSARFMGNTGYFVTFRQVDPLFSVDLTDPHNPKIIGELKIPGFSEYLQFYQEGLLIGIGQDMDEEGVAANGVKLSMFDISDPSNVKEVHKNVLEGTYSTDAFHDYKAVLVDSSKNMIGFSAYGEAETYYLFSYDKESGFTCDMKEKVSGNSYQTTRGIYVDDRLYIVKGAIIEVYDLKSHQKISDLIVK